MEMWAVTHQREQHADSFLCFSEPFAAQVCWSHVEERSIALVRNSLRQLRFPGTGRTE